ncbi:immunoglobulin domain-containing protein, partial [Fulvivirga sp. M361]|uniref:immunoglobulin domain-containing protein n=1 Tax=Fulvivirga sp. M361 TaxID=2594266 RepID=UPI0016292856
ALVATPAATLTEEVLPTGDVSGSASICEGSSTTLTFSLTGTGPYDVDYSDGTNTFSLSSIANGATVSVSPGSTTSYSVTRVADLGTSGPCLATSLGSAAVVTVVSNPVITSFPSSKSVCSGSGTSFSVLASGTSLGYQWFLNGTPISGGAIYGGSFTSPTLTISNVSGLGGSNYSVVVTEQTAPGCALV